MDIGTWFTRDNINTIVAAAALIAAGGAWRAGHRSAKATEDSAIAARESAVEAKRSADAAIRGVNVAVASLELQQEAVRPKPALRIERIGHGMWRLTNGGTAAAENIAFLDEGEDVVRWADPLGSSLAPGESRDMSVVLVASPPTSLRFTWDGLTESVHVPCPDRA